MGGISVMLLMGMLSAMYVFFIAVIAVLIIYFAVSYVFESIAAQITADFLIAVFIYRCKSVICKVFVSDIKRRDIYFCTIVDSTRICTL